MEIRFLQIIFLSQLCALGATIPLSHMENSNKQQVARNLFLHTDKTRAEIADIIDVNSKTLYLWIRNGRWAEMKAAARQSPTEVLQSFYDHIHAINRSIRQRHDQCPTFQEVEMLRKLVASTRHVQKLNIGTYIETIRNSLPTLPLATMPSAFGSLSLPTTTSVASTPPTVCKTSIK